VDCGGGFVYRFEDYCVSSSLKFQRYISIMKKTKKREKNICNRPSRLCLEMPHLRKLINVLQEDRIFMLLIPINPRPRTYNGPIQIPQSHTYKVASAR
jgi:hypothetical protein